MADVASAVLKLTNQSDVSILQAIAAGSTVVNTKTVIDDAGFRIVNADTEAFLGGLIANTIKDPEGDRTVVSLLASLIAMVGALDIGFIRPGTRLLYPPKTGEPNDHGYTGWPASDNPIGLEFATPNGNGDHVFSGFVGGGWGVSEEVGGEMVMQPYPYLFATTQLMENLLGASTAYWIMYKDTMFIRGKLKTSDKPGSRVGIGIQNGLVDFNVGGSSQQDVAVTFPTAFAEAPKVMAFPYGFFSTQAALWADLAAAPTETGVTLRIHNAHTSSRAGKIAWVAYGS